MTTATGVQPQHMVALARANTARLAAAEIKREIAAGTKTLAAALDDDRSGCVQIGDLLAAQHRWGTDRAAKLLGRLRITENRRVDALTARQKHAIAAALQGATPMPFPARRAMRSAPFHTLPPVVFDVLCVLDETTWENSRRVARSLGRDHVVSALASAHRRGLAERTEGRLAGDGGYGWRLTRAGARARDAARATEVAA